MPWQKSFVAVRRTKVLLLFGELMGVVFPREVLNHLKWGPSGGLERAEVTYLHRGAPGDLATAKGSEIVELERSFFLTEDSKIPYHRIRRIILDGKVLYDSSLRKGRE
jgi:uncharacterized protein (UPF0248 family)